MHTTEGSKVRFHHGSFDGDVEIADKRTGRPIATIPFGDLALFVAEAVRVARISQLEEATTQELLGVRDD